MHEQANERIVALAWRGTRMTSKVLAKLMAQFLKITGRTATGAVKGALGIDGSDKRYRPPEPKRGKQTMKQLVGQGAGVSNIEITDKNIKSFESIARKYGVDFSLKKDATETPPKWLVFFKPRDGDALEAAFKEYTAKTLGKSEREKPSIIDMLRKAKELVQSQVIDKVRRKDKGREL